jgi:hypothetical protein
MAGGKTDELKGRVKEAAGALTGDAKLKGGSSTRWWERSNRRPTR